MNNNYFYQLSQSASTAIKATLGRALLAGQHPFALLARHLADRCYHEKRGFNLPGHHIPGRLTSTI